MDDHQKQEFRAMVVQIADNIEHEDLKKLISLSKDHIGQRDRSKITSAIELFDELEKKDMLRPKDVKFMKHLLETGCKNKSDLVKLVVTYENKYSSTKGLSPENLRISRYLSKSLGKNFKMVLRQVGLSDARLEILKEDNPGNASEVIYKGFCECFRDLPITLENVVKALEDSGSKMLADKIRSGDY